MTIRKIRGIRLPLWIPVSAGALLLRVPLALLPGPGRDEAVYAYWSWHPEPFYAPLLQWAVTATRLLSVPALLHLRLPVLLSGILILIFSDWLLRIAGLPRTARLPVLLGIGISPWQTYTGAILHPDALVVLAILVFILKYAQGRFLAIAVAAGLALLAKPSGGLLLPAAALLYFRTPGISRARAVSYAGLALLVAAPALLAVRPEHLAALAEFGSPPNGTSRLLIAVLNLFSLLLYAGPLFSVLVLRSVWPGRSACPAPPDCKRLRKSAGTIAMMFAIFFGAMFLINGQAKANWFLPAFLALAFMPRPCLPRRVLRPALALQGLLALSLVLAFVFPDQVAKFETALRGLREVYAIQAGRRDPRLSTVQSWSQRVREYRDPQPWAKAIRSCWRAGTGHADSPRWIVSDDYGIAARLAFVWRRAAPQLIIPADGLFVRSMPGSAAKRLEGGVLVLAVRAGVQQVWPRLQSVHTLGKIPLDDGETMVEVGIAAGALRAVPEEEQDLKTRVPSFFGKILCHVLVQNTTRK